MDQNERDARGKLLEAAIIEHLPKEIADGETGGGNDDEVCIWTIEKHGWGTSIMLHYFTWHKDQWIHESFAEFEGPALLNCPIRFFEHPVEEKNRFEQWRYEVKKFHESIGPEVQDMDVGKRLVDALTRKNQQ